MEARTLVYDSRFIEARNLGMDFYGDTLTRSGGHSRSADGTLTLNGVNDFAGTLMIETAASLAPPVIWKPLLTNSAPSGPFEFTLPQGTQNIVFFRLRKP